VTKVVGVFVRFFIAPLHLYLVPEHILDLSFLKYCVNLEVQFGNQKLKLNAFENLENIRIINASSNEVRILMSFIHSKIWKNFESGIQSNIIIETFYLNKLKEIKIDELAMKSGSFKCAK
jgi:hypothetical protein